MKTTPQAIRKFINMLFTENLGIDLVKRDLGQENFFGQRIRLRACDLVYIFFEVEKKFSVSLTEEVRNDAFYTLDGLTKILESKLA